jgi:hypothetical protein
MVTITYISGEHDASSETAVIFVTLVEDDTQKTTRNMVKAKLSLCFSTTPKDIWGSGIKYYSILPPALVDTMKTSSLNTGLT